MENILYNTYLINEFLKCNVKYNAVLFLKNNI